MSHNYPSTQIKKWVLSFKKSGYNRDVEARKPEYLTDEKAASVRRFLHDPKSRFIDLTDDKGNLRETIEKKEIEGLKLIADQFKAKGLASWVCDYGKQHPMGVWPSEKCGCKERYGNALGFLVWCQKGFKICHSHQITDFMRSEFLRLQSLVAA